MYRHLTIIEHGVHVCLAHIGLVGVPGQAGGGHRAGEGDGLGQGQDGEVVLGRLLIVQRVVGDRAQAGPGAGTY